MENTENTGNTENKVVFDAKKLNKILTDMYVEKHGKKPSTATQNAIDCVNDAFMNDWQKYTLGLEKQSKKNFMDLHNKYYNLTSDVMSQELRLKSLIEKAEKTTSDAQDALKTVSEARNFHDPKIADALTFYQMIVGMKFENEEQNLANIKNASYIIWALYFNGEGSPKTVFDDVSPDHDDRSDGDNDRWVPVQQNYKKQRRN